MIDEDRKNVHLQNGQMGDFYKGKTKGSDNPFRDLYRSKSYDKLFQN